MFNWCSLDWPIIDSLLTTQVFIVSDFGVADVTVQTSWYAGLLFNGMVQAN